MKDSFANYLPLSTCEKDFILENGILTLDANVLLNLYEVSESTRERLFKGIRKFEGRRWLSYQVAEEFLRNRLKVLFSSTQKYNENKKKIESIPSILEGTIQGLRKDRLVPDESITALQGKVESAVSEIRELLEKAAMKHNDLFDNDTVLQEVLDLFKGDEVGKDFSEERKKTLQEEAEERVKEKRPPGYMDAEKRGNYKYGDIYLWLQVIDKAKSGKKPIILVTSDKKEDWFYNKDIKSPRQELLVEMREKAQQNILIYSPEDFLELTKEKEETEAGITGIESAKEELRAVNRSYPAVRRGEQDVFIATPYENSGFIEAELVRPVRNLTVSGNLMPHMYSIPALEIQLVASPEEMPKYRTTTGVGTTYDFNIHIICLERGDLLPIGKYLFEYKAVSKI